MARRWRRSFCRCRIIACRFFSDESGMFLPQRSQSGNFGLRIVDCGLKVWLCGNSLFVERIIAAPQDIVSVAGPAFQGELVSIADGRATFLVAGQQGKDSENKVIALGQLVRWGNPVAA